MNSGRYGGSVNLIDENNRLVESELRLDEKSLNGGDLLNEYLYFSIVADELSMKTSLTLSESLKQAMRQSQVLLVPNPHPETLTILGSIFSLSQNSVN